MHDEQARYESTERLAKNLLELFASATKRAAETGLKMPTARGPIPFDYQTEILWGVADNAKEFGLEATLRQIYTIYHMRIPDLGPPPTLEPFVMGENSFWEHLRAVPRNRSLWWALLDEQGLDEEDFEMWSTVRIKRLQRDIEDIFLQSLTGYPEAFASLSQPPSIERIAELIVTVPIRLTRGAATQLPPWEAKAIIERRWDDIVALFKG